MAPGKVANDFEAIINAGRRQQNQALAQELLGSSRRASAPGAGFGAGPRKTGAAGTLASRVGVAKRSSSTHVRPEAKTASSFTRAAKGNVDADWTHDLHSLNNPSANRSSARSQPQKTFQTRTERLYAAFSNKKTAPVLNEQMNIITPASAPAATTAKSFSIKGLAGPYTVMAKNFAPGTTAADIESAMVHVGGTCLESYLVQTTPVIIAELIFETKEGADAVVATFHRQEADGNILQVYHKTGPPSGPRAAKSSPIATAPSRPSNGKAEISRSKIAVDRLREDDKYDNGKRNNARADVVDGSYGFEDRMDTDDNHENERDRRLYSDDLVSNNRYDRSRDGGREPNRDRDNDRARNYYRGRGGRY